MTTTEVTPVVYRGTIGGKYMLVSRYKFVLCKAGEQPLSHHLSRIDALRAHESDSRVDADTHVWEWSESHGVWCWQD